MSSALAVNVTGWPAMSVVGPLIVPVGATTSGVTFACDVSTSLPPVPPTAPSVALASPTARQSRVASAPSAPLQKNVAPSIECMISPPMPAASTVPPAKSTSDAPSCRGAGRRTCRC